MSPQRRLLELFVEYWCRCHECGAEMLTVSGGTVCPRCGFELGEPWPQADGSSADIGSGGRQRLELH